MGKSCNFSSGFWASLDMFSIKPTSRITFRNNDVYSTRTSQVLTILLFFSCFGIFLYFGLNMFLRKEPDTIISENYQYHPEYLNISKDNFFISFGFKNAANSFFIDETIFSASMVTIAKNKTDVIKFITVPLKQCDTKDQPANENMDEYFKENPILGMYCISDYAPAEVQGSEDSVYYEFMQITITTCNNSTSNGTCKSMSEINDFFNNYRFYATMAPFTVDAFNYEEPLSQYGTFVTFPTMNVNIKTSSTITFQHIDIYTDDGIIFQNTTILKGLNKKDERTFCLPRSEPDYIVKLVIGLDKIVKTYKRKYDKLQNVLANTGGAIKMLLIFFAVFATPVVMFNFYLDLGNEYFDFVSKSDDGKFHKSELKFNIFQYFCSLFMKRDSNSRKKKILFEESKRILNNNLSLSQILEKIVELEKLKFLLLDQNQMVLFNYIPKPVISEDKENVSGENFDGIKPGTFILKKDASIKKWNQNFIEQSFSIKKTNLYPYYKRIAQKKNKTKIDEKILMLTDLGNFIQIPPDKKLDENNLRNNNENILTSEEEEEIYEKSPNIPNKDFDDHQTKTILTKSLNDLKDLKQPAPFAFCIDTGPILKDLETLSPLNKK